MIQTLILKIDERLKFGQRDLGIGQLDDYKKMVILRQEECVKIAELLETKAHSVSRRAKQFKIALIVLGVIVATRGGIDAIKYENVMMTEFMTDEKVALLGIAFLLFGASASRYYRRSVGVAIERRL